MSRAHDALTRRGWLAASGLRVALLCLCAGIALLGTRTAVTLPWVLALLAVAGAATVLPSSTWAGRVAIGGEVVVSALAVGFTGGSASALLPYLLAPAFAAGLVMGARGAILASGWAAAVLVESILLAPAAPDGIRTEIAAIATWPVLALLIGLLASWSRGLIRLGQGAADAGYAEAYRLMAGLHAVARDLPDSVDSASSAAALLEDCRELIASTSGVVLAPVHDEGEALGRFGEPPSWATSLAEPGPVARAWATGRPVTTGYVAAVPVATDDGRMVAVVALETAEPVLGDSELHALSGLSHRYAMRLDTAMLFDELRRDATTRERARMAREIHDGIAQELVSVGFGLDLVIGDLIRGRETALDNVRGVRGEVSRVVSELRLSIFDLKASTPRPRTVDIPHQPTGNRNEVVTSG